MNKQHLLDWYDADNGSIIREVDEEGATASLTVCGGDNHVHDTMEAMGRALYAYIEEEANRQLSNGFEVFVELKPIKTL